MRDFMGIYTYYFTKMKTSDESIKIKEHTYNKKANAHLT